ncbi:MAG: UvrD/REP helicase [Bacteroidetes bacterium OLB11]|nr:MAG: UvrD/REP helicase [Bacteroidetes bacterium OLB11]
MRAEYVQELLNTIQAFTETPNEDGELEDLSLGKYLQQTTLLTDADHENEDNDNVVKLMTIHAAKGLEFPIVFLVGMEETIFPSIMSMYDRDDLEEERRLFYVAITRAKEQLIISFANNRYRYGNLVQNDPSRFLDELPPEMIDNSRASKPTFQTSTKANLPQSGTNIQQKKVVNHVATLTHKVSEQFRPSDPQKMKEGMRVEHQRFGFGKIVSLEGPINNRMATIVFDGMIGEKR